MDEKGHQIIRRRKILNQSINIRKKKKINIQEDKIERDIKYY